MKKQISIFCILVVSIFQLHAQKDFNKQVNLERYKEINRNLGKALPNDHRVILIGNSITEGWVNMRPDFFSTNNFIGRGISGQTSAQLLLRFRSDVVDLNPLAVVINVGTNDIAENTGDYDLDFTLGNIKSMADIARSNNIQVILTSVLPASGFSWNPTILDSIDKIVTLNEEISAYAKDMNFVYIDYHSSLKDEKEALKSNYSSDGVHPNEICYEVMEYLLLDALNRGE